MDSFDASEIPTYADIEDAAARINGLAVRTPLLESPRLNDVLGGRLLVKAEPLQRTGAFKFRGAYNRISRIPESERGRGVVTYSSGNHAQGVAAAAQLFSIPATIIMPADAPKAKIDGTKAYGAEVVFFDRFGEKREDVVRPFIEDQDMILVKPFDDRFIIAGQGTVGREIAEQVAVADAKPDAVLVPCGGGGLISGTALAIGHDLPGTPVYAAEPEGFDETARSLRTGKREKVDPDARSICDALLAPEPGELTFSLNINILYGGFAISDEEAMAGMKAAFEYLKLVVEPGGAVALAAALFGRHAVAGNTIVVVCSGGNVDADVFQQALASELDWA